MTPKTSTWVGFLVIVGVITFSSAVHGQSPSTIYSGFLGCRFSQAVCRWDEECFDDLLFGTCQKVGAAKDDFVWDHLSNEQLSGLEQEVRRLIEEGYAWQDLYTQCVLGNILLAYRADQDIDPTFCDTGGGRDGTLTEQLSQDALRLLQQYFEDYYGNSVSSREQDLADLGTPSREFAVPVYSAESDRSYEQKKDQLVNIHKYEKSRKRMWGGQDSYEGAGVEERAPWVTDDYEAGYYPSDAQLIAALQRELQKQALDNNYDVADVENGLQQVYEEPNYDQAIPSSEETESENAQLLGDLLTGDVTVSDLSDEQIDQLTRYVDSVLNILGNDKNEEPVAEEPVENEGEEERSPDNLPADLIQESPAEDKRVHDEDKPTPKDPHDHGLEVPAPVPTSRPHYSVVETNYVDLTTNPKLESIEDGLILLNQLSSLLGLDPGDFSNARIHEGKLNFRVDSPLMNATYVGSMAKNYGDVLKNKTGFLVTKASLGSSSYAEGQVDITEATGDQGPKYFVLTFVLCGVIAGVVLAVIAVYMVRRHSQYRQKLENMATVATDAPAASSDYQDLCRQRMQSKASEKPEPLHVASRVGSVSATEQAVRSPSSRSSTSSWSEEPVASNMDISTGHIVLSYMEDHLKNRERLAQEWDSLCAYEAEPNETTVATQAANTRKNRYTDILPYDHSRVVLSSATNVSGSDYVNASTITDHDPRNPAYVATQGPLPHTVADFWQMVWEQGSVVIVNLTRLTEEGVAMCHRYWPEEGSDLYHIYEVHLVSEHIWCEDYLVRSFYLKNLQTNETRTVTQFHFLTWPDLGVPTSAKALLDFRRKVNKSYRGRSCPVIVQCSDGAGRAGTYTLIDMVLNRMSKGAKEIDIAATLEHIRDQRMNMVKTKEQFEFGLAAVAEEVHAILKALPQ